MKLVQTENTVTTLDTTLDQKANPKPQFVAVVATVERGHFVAGSPSQTVRAEHMEAVRSLLANVGSDLTVEDATRWATDTTRGMVSRIKLEVVMKKRRSCGLAFGTSCNKTRNSQAPGHGPTAPTRRKAARGI